jgi:hypothetical protein
MVMLLAGCCWHTTTRVVWDLGAWADVDLVRRGRGPRRSTSVCTPGELKYQISQVVDFSQIIPQTDIFHVSSRRFF